METKNIGILEASLRYRQGQEKIYVSTEPPAPVFVLTAEGNQDEVEAELIKKIIMNTITVIAYHKYKAVSYTHLTLPTTLHECRSRWSPYQ